jgi:hypothetical protein
MVIARQAPQICPPMIPFCSRFDSVLFTPKTPALVADHAQGRRNSGAGLSDTKRECAFDGGSAAQAGMSFFKRLRVLEPSLRHASPRILVFTVARKFGHPLALGGKLSEFFRQVHWASLAYSGT